MFGSKGIGDLFKLVGRAGEMQTKMAEIQKKAAQITVRGEAGGGLVEVTANAAGEILNVRPTAEALADPETLGPLISAAANQALRKARERLAEEMREGLKPIVGDIPIPPELFSGRQP
jgi:hypothetical protein